MKDLLFTGGYLLTNLDNKTQFGIVSASARLGEYVPTVKLLLGKQLIERIQVEEDSILINFSIEECAKLAETLKKAEESIKLLMSLSKKGN